MEKIFDLLGTYFKMQPGEHIVNFQEEIIISDTHIKISIRRRAIKHVVESRKKDLYTVAKLQNLFSDLKNIIDNNIYELVQETKEKDTSILLMQNKFEDENGVVCALELHTDDGEKYFVRTAFYRSVAKIKKILKKQK
jgi:ketopantoate reductase